MCGIAGAINTREKEIVPKMLGMLSHRGPDDEGVWQDRVHQVVLGHRRLSILDLSRAGHQPMQSSDGSTTLVFNGEIYNYKSLAHTLKEKGYVFRSTSDTEVIVHGYAEWGSEIFKKIDGMWAIALFDAPRQQLFLSRDPAGIKPLYMYRAGNTLVFSSEIQAIVRMLPASSLSVDEEALRRYLTHGYIFGEETAYREITEVPPATTVRITLPTLDTLYEKHYYPERVHVPSTLAEATRSFEELFAGSVRDTLQSDVPVGLFLSGGVDSALLGYYVKRAGSALQAFTIGFSERDFDESSIAKRIATHLGFVHETVMMGGKDVANDIFHILDSFGEPFADMSALPTYYLSKVARERGCKVALTGDGADELFGGYQTHYLPALAREYQLLPQFIDPILRSAAHLLPNTFTKLGMRERVMRFLHGVREPFPVAHTKWKQVFTDQELRELCTLPPELLSGDADFASFFDTARATSQEAGEIVSKVDFMTFLPSNCLVKSDICSMQNGLEIRVPFLNKALIDFGWSLPSELKASPFHTKKVLRAALAHVLPQEIARLPKRGFVPPLAYWLTTDLRLVMQELLAPEAIAKVGFLKYAPIKALVDDHLSGRADNAKKLWSLMSLSRFYASRTL